MTKSFLGDEKAQSSMNTVYMLLIAAIVAVVLIAVIKPKFKQGLDLGKTQPVEKAG